MNGHPVDMIGIRTITKIAIYIIEKLKHWCDNLKTLIKFTSRNASHLFGTGRGRVEYEIVFLLTMIIMYLSTDFVDGLRDPGMLFSADVNFTAVAISSGFKHRDRLKSLSCDSPLLWEREQGARHAT